MAAHFLHLDITNTLERDGKRRNNKFIHPYKSCNNIILTSHAENIWNGRINVLYFCDVIFFEAILMTSVGKLFLYMVPE